MLMSKITSKGQTTLPADLRTDLGLEQGDSIRYIRQDDGSYRIVKVASLEDLQGSLKVEGPISTEEIVDFVEMARNQMAAARLK